MSTTNTAQKQSITTMEGLQSAVANGESDRVRQLLVNQTLDELQKSYLVELAELNGDTQTIKIIKGAPSKP